ncbi:hypothetical protein H072_1564 [Dactylellina haptotyla CBS 200.50]|uniref:Ricin B lectin domain-containing protein n=1 Tax=Dactylellina haptotyla (strain CBS 200.50) TaxID=1284197 RepID=S8BY82_DACHA|nr:hypothetical protein H072_1564 [Dactylellina haptotyla CBS 200.50]
MVLTDAQRYRVVNVQSGTVLDLSGTNGKSVSGWKQNDGENQQWVTLDKKTHWYIQNLDSGKYLGVADPRDLDDGTPLIGVDKPFKWKIEEHDDGTYRISVAEFPTPITVDLVKGNSKNGTLVVLWGQHDAKNQRWKFEEVEA